MPKCGGEGNGASTRSRQYYDGRTVAAMDVLAPGIGEIIGGSQREERPEVLDEHEPTLTYVAVRDAIRCREPEERTVSIDYGAAARSPELG